MWHKLSKEEQVKYYKRWVRATLKDETPRSLRQHIIRHAKEIYEKDPEGWSASMRNLVDAHDMMFRVTVKPTSQLQKLYKKYLKNKSRYTPPPKVKKC